MALFPNTPFTDGDVLEPSLFYEAFFTYFDDQPQYLGHRNRLTDAELSNDAGAIKARLGAAENSLKVSATTGLTLQYQAGAYARLDGSVITLPGGLVTAPDNATSYVFLSTEGLVQCALLAPALRLVLAKVTTVNGAIAALEDWRPLALRSIAPVNSAVKVFGGSSSMDEVAGQSAIYDLGYYYFKNFTVPAGVTITIDKYAKIFCSGDVVVDGTINISYMAAAAAPFGGAGGGGASGSGLGAGSGSAPFAGSSSRYSYAAQPYGSSGAQGYIFGQDSGGTPGACVCAGGGQGGGGLWIEAAGTVKVSGTINAPGENGGVSTHVSGISLGSGGGAGSGGLIALSSLISIYVAPSATLSVKGGTGGNGRKTVPGGATGVTTLGASGGSGGGGGAVVLMSPSNNATGSTIVIDGGADGAFAAESAGGASNRLGGGNGAGFGGRGGQQQTPPEAGRLIVRNFVPIGS